MEPPSLRKVSRCATTPTYHRAFRLSRESLKRNVFVTIESSCVIPTQCGCWNRTSILPLPQPAYRVSFNPLSFEMPISYAGIVPQPSAPANSLRHNVLHQACHIDPGASGAAKRQDRCIMLDHVTLHTACISSPFRRLFG